MSIYIIYLTYTNDEELQLIPYIWPTNAQTIIALREIEGSLHCAAPGSLRASKAGRSK